MMFIDIRERCHRASPERMLRLTFPKESPDFCRRRGHVGGKRFPKQSLGERSNPVPSGISLKGLRKSGSSGNPWMAISRTMSTNEFRARWISGPARAGAERNAEQNGREICCTRQLFRRLLFFFCLPHPCPPSSEASRAAAMSLLLSKLRHGAKRSELLTEYIKSSSANPLLNTPSRPSPSFTITTTIIPHSGPLKPNENSGRLAPILPHPFEVVHVKSAGPEKTQARPVDPLCSRGFSLSSRIIEEQNVR